MNKSENFSYYASKYFKEYLPGQRNVSENTVYSYRDTFSKLLIYLRDKRSISVSNLKISQFTHEMINDFLAYLENEQNCSISTRNQRLAALKSFFRFLQVEEPAHLLLCQNIINLQNKKTHKPIIEYLTNAEIKLLLSQPDLAVQKGRRDLALLSLLYDSAARVQEICDVKVQDLRIELPSVIRLYGKGRKGREIPLSEDCAEILRCYINENRLNNTGYTSWPLFFNSRNEKLTRSGVSYILNKYIVRMKEQNLIYEDKHITPHCIRHSKAMHLVEANVNLIYIRDFLGHESVETTQIYAKANPEAKRSAISKVNSSVLNPDIPDWNDSPDIMSFLKSL